ncbi:MAG TPA: hypothetical protein VHL99_05720 [Candidatus Binatia bacterium]|jgi:hypothetical protein|nr:hypothetical protein [Candidatus Binatia bacterium]
MRKFWLLMVLVTLSAASCVVPESDRYGGERGVERRGGDRYVYCGGEHRLYVDQLYMDPDPIAEGQRIRAWHVRLRSDGNGECQTTLRIRERTDGDVVGRARVYYLRPGWNQIDFDPLETYRFHRREHCFDVIADIAGTGRAVDAARAFCARQVGPNRWSFR